MSVPTEEFVTRFHSLSGTTIGEKQKQFFQLLNNLTENEIAHLDFSNLHPRTSLEEKFKTEALIFCKRVPELLELLKSENPACIKRLFKVGSWFYENAFADFTGEHLACDLLPRISHNVKVKLINKLSVHLRNVQQADDMFNAIKQKYGLHLASKLLPACSFDVIISHIEHRKIKLPPQHLLLIIRNHPEARTRLLRILQNFNIETECKNVLLYFSKSDLNAFFTLHENGNITYKLGCRLSKKFIFVNREFVISNPDKYYKLLHNKQISKSLQLDFARLFKNLFPASLEKFEQSRKSIMSKLKLLPAKRNGINLYLSTFRNVYGTELWDHAEYVTVPLLKMLEPRERELRLRDDYKPHSVTEDEWKSLYKTEVSVPFLKKRISLTSDIATRATLIKLLIDTCKINEDKVSLTEVCKYVLSRHRNDHISVRIAFMKNVQNNFVLENLEEEHWSCLNELLQIFVMNQESFYDDELFLEGYIHFRLKHNLSVKDELINWVKTGRHNMNLAQKDPPYEKLCLEMFGEIIPQVCTNSNLTKMSVAFLFALNNWNKKNCDDKIPLLSYPKAIACFRDTLSKGIWIRDVEKMIRLLLEEVSADQKSDYLQLLLSHGNRYSKFGVFEDLIKHEPLLIISNIERVTRFVLKLDRHFNYNFWNRCRYLQHINIPEHVIKICLAAHREKPDKYDNAILALSCLLPTEEFIKFVAGFYPEQLRADTNREKLSVQKLICKNLRNLNPTSEALPSILNFCKGDYFKFVRNSLYSICGYTNEDRLISILTELSSRSVSIKKHSLHIAFRYMDRSCIYNAINEFMETKKNSSVRKFILKVVFNFFTKNPDDYTWNLVKLNVNALDVNDIEALDLFLQIHKIPAQYLTVFQVFAWDVLYKLPNAEGVLDFKRALVLNSISAEGSQLLPVDFCERIINSCLFKSDDVDDFHASVQSLACKYVIYCDTIKQEQRLKSLFAIIKYYVNNKWSKSEYRCKARICCSKLIQTFCSEFLNGRSSEKYVLQGLYDLWSSVIKPHEAFEDYLYVKFTLMYLEQLSIQEFTKEFAQLCNDLTQTYGLVIVDMFYYGFSNFMSRFLNCKGEDYDDRRYEFFENLISSYNSDACLLVVTLLLEDNEPSELKSREKHNLIIEKLEAKKNPIVDLYLSRYIRGRTTLDYY